MGFFESDIEPLEVDDETMQEWMIANDVVIGRYDKQSKTVPIKRNNLEMTASLARNEEGQRLIISIIPKESASFWRRRKIDNNGIKDRKLIELLDKTKEIINKKEKDDDSIRILNKMYKRLKKLKPTESALSIGLEPKKFLHDTRKWNTEPVELEDARIILAGAQDFVQTHNDSTDKETINDVKEARKVIKNAIEIIELYKR